MFDLRKLFVRELRAKRRASHDPDSDYHPSQRPDAGLEVEYQGLIAQQFRRWGISTGCVTIEVKQIGRAPDGFEVFVGMVRLAKWERDSALRVLVGLPLLEAKVRKTVRASWLADYSHFGGLWLHASEQLSASTAPAELRELMMHLAPASPYRDSGGHAGSSSSAQTSSLPPLSPAANSSRSPLSTMTPAASASAHGPASGHSVASGHGPTSGHGPSSGHGGASGHGPASTHGPSSMGGPAGA